MALVAVFAASSRYAGSATAVAQHDGQGNFSYADRGLTGFVNYCYRLVAVDANGNASRASALATGRAYDRTPPAPPSWVSAAWNADQTAVSLSWTLSDPAQQPRVQREIDGSEEWHAVSGWLVAGSSTFADSSASIAQAYRYRLVVRAPNGASNQTFNVTDPVTAA
jgi:hypothetical protein